MRDTLLNSQALWSLRGGMVDFDRFRSSLPPFKTRAGGSSMQHNLSRTSSSRCDPMRLTPPLLFHMVQPAGRLARWALLTPSVRGSAGSANSCSGAGELPFRRQGGWSVVGPMTLKCLAFVRLSVHTVDYTEPQLYPKLSSHKWGSYIHINSCCAIHSVWILCTALYSSLTHAPTPSTNLFRSTMRLLRP